MRAVPVVSASPLWMTPAFAVVPPMSKAIAPSRPSVWHSAWVPITPAAGPDSSMRMQCDFACSALETPAGRLHDQEGAGKSARPDMLVDLGEIAPHPRPDIGVGRHRRTALELAVFLRKLVRGRDEHAGMAGLEQLLGALLMGRIDVAIEKQDRDRFDPELRQLAAERHDLAVLEQRQHLAVRQHALPDLIP